MAPAPLEAAAPPPVSVRRPDDSLDGIASAKPVPASVAAVPLPPVVAVAAAPPADKREKRRLVPILLGVAAVLGIAAVALHPWRSSAPFADVTAKPIVNTNSAPPAVTAATKQAAASDPSGMDPNALPTAMAAPEPAAVSTAKTTAAPVPVAPKPEATAKLTEKDLGVMPTGDQGDLAGAMKGAVGAKDVAAETTKATDNNGANQIRPAAGQVVGAIGAVLPAARACLGPDDSIRSGSMVFASDGSVKQVSLSGGAKPTDDCIKSALSKAKLQPFADDSFITHVTVRP